MAEKFVIPGLYQALLSAYAGSSSPLHSRMLNALGRLGDGREIHHSWPVSGLTAVSPSPQHSPWQVGPWPFSYDKAFAGHLLAENLGGTQPTLALILHSFLDAIVAGSLVDMLNEEVESLSSSMARPN